MGESVVAKRVYRNFPIILSNIVNLVEIAELDIFYFDVILVMYWLHACFVSIYCRTRLNKFSFPNEPSLE